MCIRDRYYPCVCHAAPPDYVKLPFWRGVTWTIELGGWAAARVKCQMQIFEDHPTDWIELRAGEPRPAWFCPDEGAVYSDSSKVYVKSYCCDFLGPCLIYGTETWILPYAAHPACFNDWTGLADPIHMPGGSQPTSQYPGDWTELNCIKKFNYWMDKFKIAPSGGLMDEVCSSDSNAF